MKTLHIKLEVNISTGKPDNFIFQSSDYVWNHRESHKFPGSLCYCSLIFSCSPQVLTNTVTSILCRLCWELSPCSLSVCSGLRCQQQLKPGGSPRTALQQVRAHWSTGQDGQELQGFIPWARHWLIHKTLLASHSRPIELYTQKQILVKAAFITINKSRPEQTGLPWFSLFSIPISILSACCFIFPKMNSGTQQMNEKPVYICEFARKMVTLSFSAKEGRNPGKVCLPLCRKTKTQRAWAAPLPLLTQTLWHAKQWLLVLNPEVLHSGRHSRQTLTAARTPLK